VSEIVEIPCKSMRQKGMLLKKYNWNYIYSNANCHYCIIQQNCHFTPLLFICWSL